MSTKIYTGFKFKPGTTLDAAAKQLSAIQQSLAAMLRDQVDAYFVREQVRLLDALILKSQPGFADKIELPVGLLNANNIFLKVFNDFLDRTKDIERTSRRDPAVDFKFEVVLIPVDDMVCGIYYTENRAAAELFMKSEGIEDFTFWNNTDRPDEVTKETWENRRAVWCKVFNDNPVPAEMGFTRVLYANTYFPTLEDLQRCLPEGLACSETRAGTCWDRHLPSLDARVSDRVREIYQNEFVIAGFATLSEDDRTMVGMSRLLREANQKMKSPDEETQKRMGEIEALVRAALIVHPTLADVGFPQADKQKQTTRKPHP